MTPNKLTQFLAARCYGITPERYLIYSNTIVLYYLISEQTLQFIFGSLFWQIVIYLCIISNFQGSILVRKTTELNI